MPTDKPDERWMRPSTVGEMSVSVRSLLEDRELREWLVSYTSAADPSRRIQHPRVQKSGLVLAGHARGVVPARVQVLGETEISYLESLGEALQDERAAFMFSLGLSLVVVTRGVKPLPALLSHAEVTGTTLVGSPLRSSSTINLLHSVLDRVLAPSTRMHGVLIEVHGVGVLLLGPSGIGKSECALFLVERGHRLVADDQVQLTRLPDGSIRGTPLPLLRHHLEIRGLGILNIRDLYGATAVREESAVDMVVELCAWREDDTYERLGLDDQTVELLESPISKLRIPVRPGRDMAVILEISARNHLLKREGLHGAQRFADRLERALVPRNE